MLAEGRKPSSYHAEGHSGMSRGPYRAPTRAALSFPSRLVQAHGVREVLHARAPRLDQSKLNGGYSSRISSR